MVYNEKVEVSVGWKLSWSCFKVQKKHKIKERCSVDSKIKGTVIIKVNKVNWETNPSLKVNQTEPNIPGMYYFGDPPNEKVCLV